METEAVAAAKDVLDAHVTPVTILEENSEVSSPSHDTSAATPAVTAPKGVEIEISPVAESQLPLLEALLLPFQVEEIHKFDPEKNVAVVRLGSLASASELVKGQGLVDFKCKFRDPQVQQAYEDTKDATSPEQEEAISKASEPTPPAEATPGEAEPASRQPRTGVVAASERTPLSPEDPFYILFDINVGAPLFLGYLTALVVLSAFW